MSKEKFTQGEWAYKHKLSYGVCSDSQHDHQILAKYEGCDFRIASVNVHEDEDIANAHLMAAAPDMYRMLNDIAIYLKSDGNGFFDNTVGVIDKLLAKARGEQNG